MNNTKRKLNYICFILLTVLLFFLVYMLLNSLYFENFVKQTDPKIEEIVSVLTPLFNNPKFQKILKKNKKNLKHISNLSFYKGKKSYTLNKQHIYICLKDENRKYYKNNMLMHVILHELTHTIVNDIGHTEYFWEQFNEILKIADELKIYDMNIPPVKDYCLI